MVGTVQYETDRARFLGRGRTIRDPIVDRGAAVRSRTPPGTVLDPDLQPAPPRAPGAGGDGARALRDGRRRLAGGRRSRSPTSTATRRRSSAWRPSPGRRRRSSCATSGSRPTRRTSSSGWRRASSIPTPRCARRSRSWRATAGAPRPCGRTASRATCPIVLVRIDQVEDQGIVRQLLRAHEYWRLKGLGRRPRDRQRAAADVLARARRRAGDAGARGQPRSAWPASRPSRGASSCCAAASLSAEDRDALAAAARVVLLSRQGTLGAAGHPAAAAGPGAAAAARPRRRAAAARRRCRRRGFRLEFFNGLGRLRRGRRRIRHAPRRAAVDARALDQRHRQPVVRLPRLRVRLRLHLGRQQPREPADALVQRPGERSAGRGGLPPRRGDRRGLGADGAARSAATGPYVVRHGQGYSRFEHEHQGIATELTVFVPLAGPGQDLAAARREPVRAARSLSVTAYAEWVLGPQRAVGAPFVVTELDSETGALLARNAWNADFAGRVAFLDVGGRPDRLDGRPHRVPRAQRRARTARPALARGAIALAAAGAGLDPCAALQIGCASQPGRAREVVVLLGQGRDADEARRLVARTGRRIPRPRSASVRREWDDTLTALQVRTPDRSMDLLLNRWLLYQTLACRFWARAAFYQAGGAYGFRDQLQDAMAFTVAAAGADARAAPARRLPAVRGGRRPALVAHPDGQGRADPDLGRPALAALRDAPLRRGHRRRGGPRRDGAVPRRRRRSSRARRSLLRSPRHPRETATLYEHCARALDRSLAVGRARPAADGDGRLERRDEPGRRGRPGRERLARLVPARRTSASSPPIAEARGERERAPALARARGRAEVRRSSATGGTATGIAAPTSTTGRRSAPRRTTSAGSTRSRSPGR